MKYLLILYPIRPYVDVLIGSWFRKEYKKFALLYKDMIKKRYSNFKVICVFFSKDGETNNPDTAQDWDMFSQEKNYTIGACGVSFYDHCKKEIYPNPKRIISLCPKPIDELVIGGFHLWDCVDKTAKCAFEQGIKVSVDEDLTELFFSSVRLGKIPVSRETSIKNSKLQLNKAGSLFLKMACEARKDKPWMFQF